PLRSLAAFEKSEHAEDWRELMRLYLVRRTRSFIQTNYAEIDPANGRNYLTFEDGTRSYFPARVPRTVKFKLDDGDSSDQYARLYAQDVVDTINSLCLPRYGLGNYEATRPQGPVTPAEAKALHDLSRAGKRLMGFCRTNLFKRLESSGQVFIQSVERHILRNYVFLVAIEEGRPFPIGTQDASFLDSGVYDEDVESATATADMFEEGDEGEDVAEAPDTMIRLRTEEDFKRRAGQVYARYAQEYKKRFKWLKPGFFNSGLAKDLRRDSSALLQLLQRVGEWDTGKDTKLEELLELLTRGHGEEKVIVFTQFADTVRYLEAQLKKRRVTYLAGVTGKSPDPTGLAWRFSPVSNDKRDRVASEDELRVLIATDVLSEGQNLQDCAIVVNYDLPWAIVRLIQRAGRVDR
ncbi:MAG: C-terminal helicase domain-containing protein, partial [Dehalococcoidia bacterium]|nr:C-terminal helicase domain-containing protein [Dehalococcoidia bacterium]